MSDMPDVIRNLYDAVNAQDAERMLSLVADDFVEHEDLPIPPGDSDRHRVAQMFTSLFAAFPDLTMTVEDTVVEGEKAACRFRMTGTHQGSFMGIPATGRSVDMPGIDMFRIADGLVAEHWGVMDNMAMMQQLGIAPA